MSLHSRSRERGAFVAIDRGPSYPSTLDGVHFVATGSAGISAGETAIAGTTSFTATTPQFIVYAAAATRRLVLKSISLTQKGTAAGAAISVAAILDRTDRYTSGGTAGLVHNQLQGPATSGSAQQRASVFSARGANGSAIVAAAATADARLVLDAGRPVLSGDSYTWTFDDGTVLEEGAGSLLLYWFAATTAPTMSVMVDFVEEDT